MNYVVSQMWIHDAVCGHHRLDCSIDCSANRTFDNWEQSFPCCCCANVEQSVAVCYVIAVATRVQETTENGDICTIV